MTHAMQLLVGLLASVCSVVLLDISVALSQHISLSTEQGSIGETVSFTVRMDNIPKAVRTFGADVAYDRNVLRYTGTFVREELSKPFKFFDANELYPGWIRVGGATTADNHLEEGNSGRMVTLEFTVVGPGNASLALTNLMDDVTGWATQAGSFEGVASQPSSPPPGSGSPPAPSPPPTGSTPPAPSVHRGGGTFPPASTPTAGNPPQPLTEQRTDVTPQPPDTQPEKKSAASMRGPDALTSPQPAPRHPPADGKGSKTSAPTAGKPAGRPQSALAKQKTKQKEDTVSGSKASMQPLSATPEMTTANPTGSDEDNPARRSKASDTLSSVNALFSGAALLGVIFTVFLQRRELKVQKEELKCMMAELKHINKIQEKCAKEFREQVHYSFLTAKLNSLNTILHIQREKMNIENLQVASNANGSLTSMHDSSECRETYAEKIAGYVDEIEKMLKKC